MNKATFRKRKQRLNDKIKRCDNIAVLDMETDPFDNVSQEEVAPFMAVLYSDNFDPIVIWQESFDLFVIDLISIISNLPHQYTIYAHNGGKFDFMFLISKMRGKILFKGRGIMSAKIGRHELRDSYHILPERLADMAKENFNYVEKLSKKTRHLYKQEIIDYCISDCKNLLFFIKRFIQEYGIKISIGAASITLLKQSINVGIITEYTDERLRSFYMGGRVECIAGAGYYSGSLKLYDVNSMYPYAMANFNHPIGSQYLFHNGTINNNTCFIKLHCNNAGAFLARNKETGLDASIRRGEFFVSRFEYDAAIELHLIDDVTVLECVDCETQSNFAEFVLPLYSKRAAAKEKLATMKKTDIDYLDVKSKVLFLKLVMNNCYGKFAQNPRRFKEHFLTDADIAPPEGAFLWGDTPEFMSPEYWIWSRPALIKRYFNVGTSASITGAARSILLRAIHAARNPIYCDTDSIICEQLRGHDLDSYRLGAWDCETEISELVVAGKKLYAYRDLNGNETVKSKGVNGLSFNDIAAMLYGKKFNSVNFGPTLTRRGSQAYISRTVGMTAKSISVLPERRKTWL